MELTAIVEICLVFISMSTELLQGLFVLTFHVFFILLPDH